MGETAAAIKPSWPDLEYSATFTVESGPEGTTIHMIDLPDTDTGEGTEEAERAMTARKKTTGTAKAKTASKRKSNEKNNKWTQIETVFPCIRTLLLWGPPGTGKSRTFQTQNSVEISLNEDIAVQELTGHFVPAGQGLWEFNFGPIARAFRDGHTLIINEIGRASASVLDMLINILDSAESAVMTLPTGEKIKVNPEFRAVLTSNTDPSTLDPALLDRCDVIAQIKEPHPDIVKDLNAWKPQLGELSRRSYSDSSKFLSPRRFYAAKAMEDTVGFEEALELSFGDKALAHDIVVRLKTM